MAEQTEHINITLYFQRQPEKKVDLRIPKHISVYQLLKEINTIFQIEKQTAKYQIKVRNKGRLLDEEQKLSDYPITDGDIIEVLGE